MQCKDTRSCYTHSYHLARKLNNEMLTAPTTTDKDVTKHASYRCPCAMRLLLLFWAATQRNRRVGNRAAVVAGGGCTRRHHGLLVSMLTCTLCLVIAGVPAAATAQALFTTHGWFRSVTAQRSPADAIGPHPLEQSTRQPVRTHARTHLLDLRPSLPHLFSLLHLYY